MAFLVTVLKILTYTLVSTRSSVSSGWEHVKRKMHPCISTVVGIFSSRLQRRESFIRSGHRLLSLEILASQIKGLRKIFIFYLSKFYPKEWIFFLSITLGSFIWLDCNQFFIFEVLSRLMGVILLSSIFELFMIRWILSFIFRSFTRKDGNSQGLLVFLFIFYPIK